MNAGSEKPRTTETKELVFPCGKKNYLAADTSSGYLTVIAAKEGKARLFCREDCAMKHSVLLMDEIDKALRAADLSSAECDFFAAVVGAGSFTGIRIGISAMKGFCLAEEKPSLPVTSFQVAAYNALDGERPLALIDALHGKYYACGFTSERRIDFSPAYLGADKLSELVGRGYAPYACEPLPPETPVAVRYADPAVGLFRAVEALCGDENNFRPLEALYVRKSQAEEQLVR